LSTSKVQEVDIKEDEMAAGLNSRICRMVTELEDVKEVRLELLIAKGMESRKTKKRKVSLIKREKHDVEEDSE
jgi:hypothetical protein